jgi:hypothetical protein
MSKYSIVYEAYGDQACSWMNFVAGVVETLIHDSHSMKLHLDLRSVKRFVCSSILNNNRNRVPFPPDLSFAERVFNSKRF